MEIAGIRRLPALISAASLALWTVPVAAETSAQPTGAIVTHPTGLDRDFTCEVRDVNGRSEHIFGHIHDWTKHGSNDSGNVSIRSIDGALPQGEYIAIAKRADLSFSNYLMGTDHPTRMIVKMGDKDHASISIDVKSGKASTTKTALFVGFCSGDFSGIGDIP